MDDHEIEQRLQHLEIAAGLYDGLTYDEWIEYTEIKRATPTFIASHPEISERITALHKKMDEFKTQKPYSHKSNKMKNYVQVQEVTNK